MIEISQYTYTVSSQSPSIQVSTIAKFENGSGSKMKIINLIKYGNDVLIEYQPGISSSDHKIIAICNKYNGIQYSDSNTISIEEIKSLFHTLKENRKNIFQDERENNVFYQKLEQSGGSKKTKPASPKLPKPTHTVPKDKTVKSNIKGRPKTEQKQSTARSSKKT